MVTAFRHAVAPLRLAALFLAALPLLAPGVAAQQLELKREVPHIRWGGCAAGGEVEVPATERREEAARLSAQATQSALLGDDEAAHRTLLRAAVLDPSSPDLAYRLGLSLEQLGRNREALAEYCRYLVLDAESADAAEVRERLPRLVEQMGPAVSAAAADAYRRGIAHYDAGRYTQAESSFQQAALAEPAWSDAVYNRAIARFAGGRGADAVDDLRAYLEMNPGAPDFRPVLDIVLAEGGRSDGFSPELAFASGLLVPGLGHFTTGRMGRGAVFLGSAAGVLGAAFAVQRVQIVCRSPVESGVCPAEDVLEERTERPYIGIGVLGAAAIGVLGALDAYRGARVREQAPASASQNRVRTGATLLPPAVRAGHENVRMDVIRIRF